jgi:hypothetical protein
MTKRMHFEKAATYDYAYCGYEKLLCSRYTAVWWKENKFRGWKCKNCGSIGGVLGIRLDQRVIFSKGDCPDQLEVSNNAASTIQRTHLCPARRSSAGVKKKRTLSSRPIPTDVVPPTGTRTSRKRQVHIGTLCREESWRHDGEH